MSGTKATPYNQTGGLASRLKAGVKSRVRNFTPSWFSVSVYRLEPPEAPP